MTILQWHYNYYALFLFLCVLVNIWVTVQAWKQRYQVGYGPALVLVGATFWTFAYAVATGMYDLPNRLIWAKLQYIGMALAVFAMPMVILSFLGREKWLNRWTYVLLAIVPGIGLALALTNEAHGLIWEKVDLQIVGSMALLKLQYGPYFWFYASYNFLIMALGALVFLRILLHSPRLQRQQATILFIATLFPAITLVLYLARLNPLPDLDLMPLGYSLCGWTLAFGLVRYQLFNLLPVARDAVIEKMTDGVFVLDRQNRVIDANPALLKLVGQSIDQVIGLPVAEVFYNQPDLVKEYSNVKKAVSQFSLMDGETERSYELFISPLNGTNEQHEARVFVVREITERRSTEEALKLANQRLEDTIAELEHRNQEMVLLNELDDLMKMSESTEATYDVIASTACRLFRNTFGFLAVPDNGGSSMRMALHWGKSPVKNIIKTEECFALREGRLHSVDPKHHPQVCGHTVVDELSASVCVPMLVQGGEVTGLLHVGLSDPLGDFNNLNLMLVMAMADSVAAALTNIRLRETLRQQSIRDPLTNLFNRRYMEETFAREISRAERSKYPLGVVMFDIDHFKLVNDRFGHPAGDMILRDLGALMLSFIRGGDVACRYGGEEFVLIMPEAGLQDVFQKGEKLRQKVKQLHWLFHEKNPTHISISIGVAAFPQHGKTVSELLQAVDAALYRAKEAGRDRVML